MDDSDLPSRCSKTDCPVATTGVCLEGHAPPPTCPYFGKVSKQAIENINEDGDDADVSSDEITDVEQPQILLPSGEPLTQNEVEDFLRARDAMFITIVGDRDSGKTTLVCSIYDKFLKGSYAGYSFCESRTLIGLERRSHYSRIASERSKPDTPHTSISDGLRYFHLAVCPSKATCHRVDMMLSDRAGEIYKQSRSNSSLIEQLVEVPQAHKVVILLDGGRVADAVNRSGAVQSVRQTLRAFLDGGALDSNSIVQVVTTKIDLLLEHPEYPKISAILSAFNEKLKQDFGPRLGNLSFWEVSARDPDGKYVAYGVDNLFIDWANVQEPTRTSRMKSPNLSKEFDLLLFRTTREVQF